MPTRGRPMSLDFTAADAGHTANTLLATPLDLARRFSDIPLSRIRFTPLPGEATENDVLAIHDHEGRLFELIDGTLIEKAMGTYESLIAMRIALAIGAYLKSHRIGIVLGADGMLR